MATCAQGKETQEIFKYFILALTVYVSVSVDWTISLLRAAGCEKKAWLADEITRVVEKERGLGRIAQLSTDGGKNIFITRLLISKARCRKNGFFFHFL